MILLVREEKCDSRVTQQLQHFFLRAYFLPKASHVAKLDVKGVGNFNSSSRGGLGERTANIFEQVI